MTTPELSSERDDKLQIAELLNSHFNALDSRDWTTLYAGFTEDAEARYHVGSADETVVAGGRRIVDLLIGTLQTIENANHSISNQHIHVDGDHATSSVFAVAFILVNGRVLLRGLRYEDRLLRRDNRWLIHRRQHQPLWQTELPAMEKRLPR